MNRVKKTPRIYTPVHSVNDLLDHFDGFGDKTLYRYLTAPDQITDLSYAAFARMVRRLAAGFDRLDIAGRRVAIVGETSPRWVAAYLAAIACGGVAVPVDRELLIGDVEGLLASADVEVIVYAHAFNQKLAHAVAEHPTLRFFIPMDASDLPYETGERVIPYDRVLETGAAHTAYTTPSAADPDRLAEMLFTSGTTGTSKCVMLSEKNIVSAVNGACATVDFGPDDTIVSVLPIHHTYELCCMLAAMNYGMTVAINDSLKHVLKSFRMYRPTGLILVPLFVTTIYKRIFDEARRSGREKQLRFALKLSRALRRIGIDVRHRLFRDVLEPFGGRLNKIICGGAPLNPEMCRVFDEFGITVAEGYGITECAPLISVNPYFARRRGSVGPTTPTCTARIDAPDGTPCPVGFSGEITVHGDNVMLGYYQNPEANADAFTADGWFRTGDIGYMDRDGYLYITGRKKSVIVLENGKNVFPEEIEEHLGDIPDIAESVVVARQAQGSEEVILTAIIYPNFSLVPPTLTDDEIRQRLTPAIHEMNKKLASFKHIRAIEIRREEFPKTTSRKIRRHLIH